MNRQTRNEPAPQRKDFMTASPADMRLFLIGTVHRDPRGEERLRLMLERLRPALLTVEMSPYAYNYRRLHSRPQLLRLERIIERLAKELGCPLERLDRHPAVVGIRDLLELPFEYRAAKAYAENSGAALELVDLSEVSAPKLRRVETGLITYQNLKVLLRQPTEVTETGNEDYAAARQFLHPEASEMLRRSFLSGKRGSEGIGSRDAAMASAIEGLLQRWPERRLAHIGGWVHMVDDPQQQTLYSRLSAWQPVRRLLVES